MVFGLGTAYMTALFLGNFRESVTQILITFTGVYLVYLLAEDMLHLSGVLSVVVFGQVLNSFQELYSEGTMVQLEGFFETMSFMARTVP